MSSPGRWTNGTVPPNVRLGDSTIVTADHAFKRFRSKRDPGLIIGSSCTMDGVHFAVGENACVEIGDFCYFTNAILLTEESITVGNYVVIGWNTTIADSDFHPLDPALRIADAVACSPLRDGRPRPRIEHKPVVIEDDVWIGPNATILKGVTIGAGSWIEPGALITQDVPPLSRVLGNPAQVTRLP
jgi:acetyltransferase-like isoleucine patch superfamily enzyme